MEKQEEAVITIECDCCGTENRRPVTEREMELIEQGRNQHREELLATLGKIIMNPDLNSLSARVSMQVLMAGLASEGREDE